MHAMMLAGWRLSKMLILGGTCLLSSCGCLDVFCAECLRALRAGVFVRACPVSAGVCGYLGSIVLL
jgi:hypothetical protein